MKRCAVLVILILACVPAFAGEPVKDNLTVREALGVATALANMNCQGGYILRDGSKETVTCKVFDYVSKNDKKSIEFSRAIADNIATLEPVAATYRKLRNAFIAAFKLEDRDRDGNLNQVAAAKLAVWDDEYLAGPAGLAGAGLTHFKRSDLEAVGFQPGILAGLRPITDVDN